MDRDRMIAAIVKEYHVRLDITDPAFLVVELNRLALEASIARILAPIDSIPRRIASATMDRTSTLGMQFAARYSEQLADTRAALAEQVGATCRAEVAEAAGSALAAASRASTVRMAYFAGMAIVIALLAFGIGYLARGETGSAARACVR